MGSSLTMGSLARIGAAVFAIVAAITLPMLQANLIVDWALVQQFGEGHTYKLKSVRPSFSGFTASDVEIEWGENPVTIRRVNVDVGFWGMLTASYTRNSDKALRHATIVFEDIRNSDGVRLTQDDLPVGGVSASPFEAEGCGDDTNWIPAELNAMGLSLGQSDLTLKMDQDSGDYTLVETLSTQGIGRASLTSKGLVTDQDRRGNWEDIKWSTESWEFEDQGFVAARNAYCAKQAGIQEGDFLARHIASIERLMASEGLAASPEMLKLYIEFARFGGTLVVDGSYAANITSANYSEVSWGDQVGSLSGEMRRDQTTAPLSFSRVPKTPFEDADADKSTFAILLKEGRQFSGVAGADASSSSAALTGLDGAPLTADDTASETLVISAQAPPLALAPEMIPIYHDEPEYITDFQQVASFKGRRIRLERRARPPMIAQVLGGDAKSLRVRVRQPGGYADIEVPRGEFVRARVFQ